MLWGRFFEEKETVRKIQGRQKKIKGYRQSSSREGYIFAYHEAKVRKMIGLYFVTRGVYYL